MIGAALGGGGPSIAGWMVAPILFTSWAARIVWRVWRNNRGRQNVDPKVLPADFAPLN